MNRQRVARLAVTILDGPWQGRTILVDNPAPRRIFLSVQNRDGSTGRVEYMVDKGPHGLIGQKVTATDPNLPTIGWRGWNLIIEEGKVTLRSSAQDTAWPVEGPLVAECLGGSGEEGHSVPAPGCSCGIYATRTLGWLREHNAYIGQVFGLVTLWGRSRQHEDGFRYERAYPLCLVINAHSISESGDSGGILGADLGVGSDEVDHDMAAALGRMALLQDAYRVPVAMGAPERGLEIVNRMVSRGLLPRWSEAILPPDVRRQASNGGGD